MQCQCAADRFVSWYTLRLGDERFVSWYTLRLGDERFVPFNSQIVAYLFSFVTVKNAYNKLYLDTQQCFNE